MILLDTNIVIYLYKNQLHDKTIEILQNTRLDTCNIIVAEVLGYPLIEREDSKYFKNLFMTMKNYAFDEVVTEKVIELQQTTNIKLRDAIIAATTLVNGLTLWTHNTKDFKYVPNLQIYNPFLA